MVAIPTYAGIMTGSAAAIAAAGVSAPVAGAIGAVGVAGFGMGALGAALFALERLPHGDAGGRSEVTAAVSEAGPKVSAEEGGAS